MDNGTVIQTCASMSWSCGLADRPSSTIRVGGARGGICQSDVDVMAEFDPSKRLTLIELVRIENRLSDLLGAKLDLAKSDAMREPVRECALSEAIRAF